MDPIQKILESRRQGGTPAPATPAQPEVVGDKFYSVLVGDAIEEQFLEIRFKTGTKLCLAYNELVWFDYDPEAGIIDLEFGVMLVILEGRGLGDDLFDSIKRKRVSWVKEADTEKQDHKDNSIFIKEIRLVLPDGEQSEQTAAGEQSET